MPCVNTSLGPACLSRRLADEKEDVTGGENSGANMQKQRREVFMRERLCGSGTWDGCRKGRSLDGGSVPIDRPD